MNDIDSQNNKKESNFKVYKDKLASFIPNFNNKKNEKIPSTKTDSINPQVSKPNTTIPPNNSLNTNKTPSLDEIRQKIKSQSINQETPTNNISTSSSTNNIPPKPPTDSNHSKINGSFAKTVIKVIIITLIALIVGYVIVNYQAISLRFKYWREVEVDHKNWSELYPVTLHKAQSTAQKLDENYLYIPMVNIEAPVNWGISENDVSGLLSSGLVQYKASALPDDASGDIYIIGNTSGPLWSSSLYKNVFTLLDKTEPNQVITLIYNNKIYSYRIFEIDYLSNSDIIISPGSEEQSVLNLLAQYPIGLNWKTLKVRAELFKIESNIANSMQDNINELEKIYNESQTQLKPIEVKPTPTTVPTPTENNLINPELLPQHFLPEL